MSPSSPRDLGFGSRGPRIQFKTEGSDPEVSEFFTEYFQSQWSLSSQRPTENSEFLIRGGQWP